MKFDRESIRANRILEGRILTEEEFESKMTCTFFPDTESMVENFYDATV